MIESQIIKFGSDYEYNFTKNTLENWQDMREYYLSKKLDIGDYPVMTDDEMVKLAEEIKNIR